MVKLQWTLEANKWLKEIHEYIAIDNPVAAKNVVDSIYQKAQILRSFPEIGYAFDHESDTKYSYCSLRSLSSCL